MAAAAAVRSALEHIDPEIECRTVDSYRYAASIFAHAIAAGYIAMLKTVPALYGFLYDRVERATHVPTLRRLVGRLTAANLRRFVDVYAPDLVVCTHAFPCGVMSEYKRRYDAALPVVGVVTDFAVHPFWIYSNIDAYAVASPQMRTALVDRGVAVDRIVVSGIPIDARFGTPRASIARLRAELHLPIDTPIVLVMAGGVGLGPLERIMSELERVTVPLAAVVIVGRNAVLERRVTAAAERAPYPVRVRGFVDNVFDYMHACDLLISKPGGLTSSEALAARLPMISMRPLPGQEERNARFLRASDAAVDVSDDADLAAAVTRLLRSASERAQIRHAIERLRHPEAARAVAGRVVTLLNAR